ncbi:NarL/FixJ family response regulator [Erythrobacter litoralis]|uniref:Chemotaxis protein CheY n=1 Tax=Erythrobacter litoralis TaxID=39960 RepID=A0A074MUL0_9SPHN|nr:response regulator transcription factor [Erythrobacter litoralis]AOL23821.1 NarL/FixJ family response regulator [Erythrobacter litoralis]KEO98696.1 chemotaxis protein CheY [Erythrobacter litoralis]
MTRVLIADDHDLLRDVLRSYLEAEGGFSVVTAADLPSALELVAGEEGFDLLLLDYAMPGMNGFDGLAKAIAAVPGTPVALMSGMAPVGVAEKVLACGAAGFLPKTLPARSVVNAIRFMAAGETYMPLDMIRQQPDQGSPDIGLSPREREVLSRLCEGLANKEIARDLGLREPTIKLHVKTICRKLGARNRTHAAMLARERALC